MRLRTFACIVVLIPIVLVGCKSKDQQVAEALQQELLVPIEKAKTAKDAELLEKSCLAVEMVLEAPDVAEQVKAGQKTKEVVAKLKEACKDSPTLEEMKGTELDKEAKKAEALEAKKAEAEKKEAEKKEAGAAK